MIINGNRIDLLEDMQTVMVERKEKLCQKTQSKQ